MLLALAPAALVGVMALGAVLAGLMPLILSVGVAAGGVLETGQVEPMRWWLGALGALLAYGLVSWKWPGKARLLWLAVLIAAICAAVMVFVQVASSGQPRIVSDQDAQAREARAAPVVGVMTALPLFWPEGQGPDELLKEAGAPGPSPLILPRPRVIDHVDAATLGGIDALLIAQPRLLAAEELTELDRWVRSGGRALIFADPLLMWPSVLPPGDPRRAPLTSLLDPLLSHWGLVLESVPGGGGGIERQMLASGHVVMLAGASRFTAVRGGGPGTRCALAERGLMALCRVGRGEVRLVADADLLDERLWLVDPAHPRRPEAWAADVPALVEAWLTRPLSDPLAPAPRRVMNEGALTRAMRAALLALLLCVGLGWGAAMVLRDSLMPQNGKGGWNEKRTKFKGEQKKG